MDAIFGKRKKKLSTNSLIGNLISKMPDKLKFTK